MTFTVKIKLQRGYILFIKYTILKKKKISVLFWKIILITVRAILSLIDKYNCYVHKNIVDTLRINIFFKGSLSIFLLRIWMSFLVSKLWHFINVTNEKDHNNSVVPTMLLHYLYYLNIANSGYLCNHLSGFSLVPCWHWDHLLTGFQRYTHLFISENQNLFIIFYTSFVCTSTSNL